MPSNYLLKHSNLHQFLETIQRRAELIVPVKRHDGSTSFAEYEGSLYLGSNTTFPPKKYFLKPRDTLFEFVTNGKKIKLRETIDSRKRVIFGIRSCDLHALQALDRLFIDYYYKDPYYAKRRENTILLGLQCTKVEKNCFCSSMGTDKAAWFDLFFTPAGNNYYVEVRSKKGKALLNRLFKRTNLKKPRIDLKFKKRLNAKGIEDILMENPKHRAWREEAARCLSCTACTEVCPTCYCFSVKDEFDLASENSKRFRIYSSCQLKNFTAIAGGAVFRESRTSRLRQFVNHNLSYYKREHDIHKCVGCGRCINECPVDIDLVAIAKAIRKGTKNG